MTTMRKQLRGITLIELMVVVAIIAILAAIAVPSYQNYVRESRRGVAQAQMTELAAVLERFFSDNNTYVGFPLGDAAGNMFPDHMPIDAPHANRSYDTQLQGVTATGYTIRVDPTGSQTGDGFMTLTSTGAKAWDRDDSGAIGGTENTWED